MLPSLIDLLSQLLILTVNSTLATAIDYICWMEGGGITTGERSWGGWKHSYSPGGLDWWPLTLSGLYSLLSKKDKLQNTNLILPTDGTN